MAIGVLQESAGTHMSGSPGTKTITVSAGSLIHVWIAYDPTVASAWTVSDNVNGSYGAAVVTSATGVGGLVFLGFRFNGSAAGSITISATSSPATGDASWWVVEIGGQKPGTVLDGTASNYQPAPGTGTDAMTSGNITPANSPGLLLGWAGKNVSPPAAAGTGFSSGGTDVQTAISFTSENKRITSTTAVAATFTCPDSSDSTVIAVIYDEAPGPTINTQPASATVYVGQRPSFSVVATASAGGGALSYQWQLNGVNDGTNSSSYSPSSPMTLADNGDQVQVLVTDSNGTTPSSFASIRVLPLPPSTVSAGDGLIGGRDGGRRLAN